MSEIVATFNPFNDRLDYDATLTEVQHALSGANDGELYCFKVENDIGKPFGYLKDVLVIVGREILLVKYLEKEIMIPNIEEFVKLFDFENKTIFIKNHENFIS